MIGSATTQAGTPAHRLFQQVPRSAGHTANRKTTPQLVFALFASLALIITNFVERCILVSICEQTAPMRACYVGFRAIVTEENGMKSSTEDEVKGKFQEVNGKTKKELGKLNDPTLEGKDENKVGRVQRKTGQAENVLEK
jgi:uncharacterized protein YjbJ (UPF0337 family)